MKKPDIIAVGDDWFEIVRVTRDYSKYDAGILRQLWNCDRTFRREGMLYFCREIPKVNYIEL